MGALAGPDIKFKSVISGQQQRNSSAEQLNSTALETAINNPDIKVRRAALGDKTENLGETKKQLFWQAATEYQRPKPKVLVNDTEIEGLLDIDTDIKIISPKSWPPDWPFQEVNIQQLGNGTLSLVKQSLKWTKCIEPEGQIGKLKLYVAGIAIGL